MQAAGGEEGASMALIDQQQSQQRESDLKNIRDSRMKAFADKLHAKLDPRITVGI
jgi:2-methylcitrate dehydratase PrpD